MAMVMRLEALMEGVEVAGGRVRATRAAAGAAAWQNLCEVEDRLVKALAGETLWGLSNLGTSKCPFYAARLLGASDVHLTADGRTVVVVDKYGKFVVAGRVAENVRVREMVSTDLRAEDASAMIQAVQSVVERHVERAGRRAATYERMAQLGQRLAWALEVANSAA